jgi:hypothetical protein
MVLDSQARGSKHSCFEHKIASQVPINGVDSMGHRNTGSKSGKRSLKSHIRARALIHTESTVLFRFN